MKVTYEIERTFPLEQYGNVKPKITFETEVKTEEERSNFLQTAEAIAIERFKSFKKAIKNPTE